MQVEWEKQIKLEMKHKIDLIIGQVKTTHKDMQNVVVYDGF